MLEYPEITCHGQTNALAYFAAASVTNKKCYITLTQDERLLDSTASAVGVNGRQRQKRRKVEFQKFGNSGDTVTKLSLHFALMLRQSKLCGVYTGDNVTSDPETGRVNKPW
jgi:hypothetical protein